jgi:iron(III) transport system permease protein
LQQAQTRHSNPFKTFLPVAGTWWILALALIPLWGMFFALEHSPTLFEAPPLSFADLLPLILRTLVLALGVSLGALTLGTGLAFVHVRYNFKGNRWLSLMSTLPLAVPSYLLAAMIRESLAPRGSLGAFFGTQSAFTGMSAALLVLTLSCTPYVQILVTAALRQTPASPDEAARTLGATPWRRFISLTLPRLRPTWAFALVIVAFYVISDFGAVAVLDCEVLTWALYQARHAPADAMRMGFGLVACTLPLLAFIRWLHGQQRAEKAMSETRVLPRVPLPKGLVIPTYLTYAFIIGLGLLLPLFTIAQWIFAGLQYGEQFATLGPLLQNTLIYTVFGALLTLAAALLPAYTIGRNKHRYGAVAEHSVYATSAVPGILIATGIFFLVLGLKQYEFNTSILSLLETSGLFLIFGYVMRFLSEGYAALKPAILNLDLRHEESAQTLGAKPWRIFQKITFPAIKPGIKAAYLLLFIAIAKELPITLMLTPLGKQTLAYRIFDAQQEGVLPDAGLAALLLLIMALCVQLVLMRWNKS